MKVIVLGSGESCLDLSKEEISEINNAEVRIAINKFALFSDKLGINYTHVYFNDIYGVNIYVEIIKSLSKRSDVTVITNRYLAHLTYSSIWGLVVSFWADVFYRLRSFLIAIVRLGRPGRSHELILARPFRYYRIEKDLKMNVIRTAPWDDKNALWAQRLDEPLFSFRGSIMSVLNFISVKCPGSEVVCVGTDFNGSRYFYEKELEESGIDHEDHTTNEVKKQGIHYSFHDISQGKLSDAFPKVLNSLAEKGISLTCNNERSLLVKECNVEYKSLRND